MTLVNNYRFSEDGLYSFLKDLLTEEQGGDIYHIYSCTILAESLQRFVDLFLLHKELVLIKEIQNDRVTIYTTQNINFLFRKF